MVVMVRLRQVVFFTLLWAIALIVSEAFVGAESLDFRDDQIRFYPAQRMGDRILIPFVHPPAENEEVLLLYHHTDLVHLRRLQNEPIMPKEMANPRPHYVYGPVEGRLSDPRAQFLVAVGKGITSLLRWRAAETMNTAQSAGACMTPDKDFSVTGLQVLASEELNTKFYYLQSTHKVIDAVQDSETSMKEIVGMVRPEGSCQVLAYNTSDAYGLHNTGTREPVGPITGIIELSDGRSLERWLVLRSAMHEVWGYTFIELRMMPSNHEPKRRFLPEDRA